LPLVFIERPVSSEMHLLHPPFAILRLDQFFKNFFSPPRAPTPPWIPRIPLPHLLERGCFFFYFYLLFLTCPQLLSCYGCTPEICCPFPFSTLRFREKFSPTRCFCRLSPLRNSSLLLFFERPIRLSLDTCFLPGTVSLPLSFCDYLCSGPIFF